MKHLPPNGPIRPSPFEKRNYFEILKKFLSLKKVLITDKA